MAEGPKRSRPRTAEPPRSEPRAAKSGSEPHPGDGQVCTVGFCPICLAVTAVQPLKPEAVEHLLNAGREFLLAMSAVSGRPGRRGRWQGEGADAHADRHRVSDRQAVGIDIGGTKIAAIRISRRWCDPELAPCIPTPATDQNAALPAIQAAADEVIEHGVAAIGVGMAGLIDIRSGILLSTPNLVWRNLPLAEGLATFGLPVTVNNDATAAAWAESRLGASRGYDDSLFVGVGTGIGGGIVAGGQSPPGAPRTRRGDRPRRSWSPTAPSADAGTAAAGSRWRAGWRSRERAGRAVTEEPDSAIARLAGGDPRRATGELVTEAAQARRRGCRRDPRHGRTSGSAKASPGS